MNENYSAVISYTYFKDFESTFYCLNQINNSYPDLDLYIVVTKTDKIKIPEKLRLLATSILIQPEGADNNNGREFWDNHIKLLNDLFKKYSYVTKIDSDSIITNPYSNIFYTSAWHTIKYGKDRVIYGNFYTLSKSNWNKLYPRYNKEKDYNSFVRFNFGENRALNFLINSEDLLPEKQLNILNVDFISNWRSRGSNFFITNLLLDQHHILHLWSDEKLVKSKSFKNVGFILSVIKLNIVRGPKSIFNVLKSKAVQASRLKKNLLRE